MSAVAFDERIATSPLPVVVDVWAPWCGPCKMMKPVLEKIREEFQGSVEVVEVNADEEPELARKLNVFSLPTILVYNGGEEKARRMGAQNESNLRSLFEAARENRDIPKLRGRDRILRIAAAALLYGLAGRFEPAWVFQAGAFILFFSAIHDRCPLFQSIKGAFKRS